MKKIITIFLCFTFLIISAFSSISISAEEKCTITIGKTTGNLGEMVYVPINISENPGISAISISITYDSKALQFDSIIQGTIFNDSFMIKDHPSKNLIRAVLVEPNIDSANNGVIMTLKFKIAENATAGFYKISIDYQDGDFSSRKLQSIMPKIISGGIVVKYNPQIKNCSHKKYGDWSIIVKPTCKTTGIKQKECLVCGKKVAADIEKISHQWKSVWTIDTPATKNSDGSMTRHCEFCTSCVDRITFSLSMAQKAGIKNVAGAEIPKNEFTMNLFKEQNPGDELTQNSTNSSPVSSEKESSPSTITSSETTEDSNTENATSEIISSSEIDKSESPENTESKTDNIKHTDLISKTKLIFIIALSVAIVFVLLTIAFVISKKPKK